MEALDIIYLIASTVMVYCSILWFTVFFRNRKTVFNYPKPIRLPPVTMLVPVHNGEKYVEKCLNSILNIEYPKEKLKIIVIDDGSTDRTSDIVKKYKNVKLITQTHSGKAVAMNNGLKHVKTDVFGCMDVDSFPEKDYLMKMVGYIENGTASAVTPAMKVSNKSSLLSKIQWVEYIYNIFLRKSLSLFNCEYVLPGPGSIYKTSLLKKLGGFDESILTEDTEIAFRMQKKKYKIKNSLSAYVHTEAPNTFRDLFKQRLRWYRGFLQNVRMYSSMVGNADYGNLGLFLLPTNLFMIFFGAFLFISFAYKFFSSALNSLINWSYIGYSIMPLNFSVFNFIDVYTFFLGVFILIALIIVGFSIAYSGEKSKLRKTTDSYILFLLIYPFLITLFWIVSIIYEVFGVKRKW